MKRGYRMRGYGGSTLKHAMACVEKKFKDVALSFTPILATGETAQQVLPTIARGFGSDQRIGQNIWLDTINFQATLAMPESLVSASGDESTVVKWAIVVDRQAQGGTPTWIKVFESADVNTFRNLEYTQQFGVLRSGKCVFNRQSAGATTDAAPEIKKQINWFHKFKRPMKIDYLTSNDTGVMGAVLANSIWLLVLSENSANTTVGITGNVRVRYTD